MKKTRLWQAKTIAILAALLVVILLINKVVISLFEDDPPPADAAFRLSPRNIPKSENGFYLFFVPSLKADVPRYKEPGHDIFIGKAWDSAIAKELLKRNSKALQVFEKGAKFSTLYVPEKYSITMQLQLMSNTNVPPPGQRGINFIALRELSYLCALKAELLFRNGREAEAMDEVMVPIKVGKLFEDSCDSVSGYSIGLAMNEIGLRKLRDLLVRSSLLPAVLMKYEKELDFFQADREGLANAIRIEYMTLSKLLDDPAQWYLEKPAMRKGFHAGYYFKPNKTRKMAIAYFKVSMDNLQKSGNRMKDVDLDVDVDVNVNYVMTNHYLDYVTENAAGRRIWEMTAPDLCRLERRQVVLEDFLVRGTQVFLAMKQYKIENGKLPQSLDQLVPRYFSRIPSDPFSGGVLQYDPVLRRLFPDNKTGITIPEEFLDIDL